MSATDLRRLVRRSGFVLHELLRADGRRFVVCDRRGLTLRGSDEEPLTREEVIEFLARFEDRTWLP